MQYYKLIAEPMHYYQLLIDNYVVGSEWQDDVVRNKTEFLSFIRRKFSLTYNIFSQGFNFHSCSDDVSGRVYK